MPSSQGRTSTRFGAPGDRDSSRRARRRAREEAIIATTRALFDERGMGHASVDEIARAAGINKALVYRAFDSKEEVFVLAVVDYLGELRARELADDELDDPVAALRRSLERFVAFCREYPAFLDCALSLMQQPARDLRDRVSEGIWLRLGRATAACLGHLERILATGAEQGDFLLDDPAFTANRMYAQVLGSMHLARFGVGVRELVPDVAATFPLHHARVSAACIEDALALARFPHPETTTR